MAISAADVKRLREMTGVGMMDCKAALGEADGDFDKAVELLRKKGQKVAAKRAERDANEGIIATALADDQKTGVIAEVNCETDFVARNEDFGTFANQVAALILKEQPANQEALNALSFDGNRTVEQAVVDMTGKIGEKIDIRRFNILKSEAGKVVAYVHPGSRLAVLVDVSGDSNVNEAGTDVAMQVAALNPIAAHREEVSSDVTDKEMEIARDAARLEGKPDNIIDRIAQGKVERFYKDHVLVEQPFVKDASVTVKDMLKKAGVEVHRFVRFALGD